MPLYKPPGYVLLDVVLRRNDDVRRWTIHAGIGDEWACRLVEPNSVTVFACCSTDEAVAKMRDWQGEIAAAMSEGWSGLSNEPDALASSGTFASPLQ